MPEIKLKKRCKYACDIFPELLKIGLDAETAMDFLNGIKDADVVEVSRGEWKETTEPLGWQDVTCAECSVCGDSYVVDDNYDIDDVKAYWKYCPNCGAKMDGERKTE